MVARHIDPSTARYLSLLCGLPTLTKEEELSLARRYREHGDGAARQRVINANLRHVVALALRYRTLGVPVGDLIAQGSLGLLQALDRFDPNRGLRVATYANHWIRAEMLAAAIKGRSMVGGGVGALGPKYALRMRREHGHLEARLGASPEVLALLGERYQKTPEQIAEILQRLELRDASLEASSGPPATLGEQLGAPVEPVEERTERSRSHGAIVAAVSDARVGLSARERYIIEHRLMADDEVRQSLKEIGRHFGVSRERARQLEAALKGKLRTRLKPIATRLELHAAA
jgi:RNA polymerase sigma-32 factor